jgi:hypothetical protein
MAIMAAMIIMAIMGVMVIYNARFRRMAVEDGCPLAELVKMGQRSR